MNRWPGSMHSVLIWPVITASMVASTGETDRDLACTQLIQKLRDYNDIEFKHYTSKIIIFRLFETFLV
jgi:hypothetical protein